MKIMSNAVLVPLTEYLATMYHPDREYVDGALLERNVGELRHGDAQTSLALYIRAQCPGFWAVVEVRAQVKPDRFRVPDVSIMRGGRPAGRIISSPPEVVAEILSPEDRNAGTQDKIDDYLTF